jgi:hypothetical protein
VSQIITPGNKARPLLSLYAGTSPEAAAARIRDQEHGVSQPRVSQLISPGTYKLDRKRGARVDISAGTSHEAAAARIRERLGVVVAVERRLDAAAIEAHAGGGQAVTPTRPGCALCAATAPAGWGGLPSRRIPRS